MSRVSDHVANVKECTGRQTFYKLPFPKTGFYRDGYCKTGAADSGSHVVAAIVTQRFLAFTMSRGKDLETPRPMYDFLGLNPVTGVALPVVLETCHEKT